MLEYNSSLDQFTEVVFEEFSSSGEENEANLIRGKRNNGSVLILRNGRKR